MSSLFSFFLATRPKTLTAAIIPVWAGCMAVWRMTGSWDLRLAVLTALSALCLQVACNFFNDAIDHRKKADTDKRLGPKRMTASGALSRRQVLAGACAFLLLACSFAWPLYELRGWPIIAIGIPSLFFCYGYTGGPFPLAYRGLGEIFVVLFFGFVAVLGTILVQIGIPGADDHAGTYVTSASVYRAGIWIGLQCGALSAVMIGINNIRDRKEDEQTGKRTFAVRFGDMQARKLVIAFIAIAYLSLYRSLPALDIEFAKVWWAWIPVFIFALYLALKVLRTPADKRFNRLLAMASAHLLLYLLTYTFC